MYTVTPDWTYPAGSILCAGLGAAFDLRTRRIPNSLTLTGLAAGPLLHFALGGWRGAASACAAALIAGILFALFWLAGGMGGGDVKLIAATASLAGLPHLKSLLLMTALAGGVLAVAAMVWKGRARETLRNTGSLLMHHASFGLEPHPVLNLGNPGALRMPYGVSIAAGALLSGWIALGGH